MHIPDALEIALEQELQKHSHEALKKAAERISLDYRAGKNSSALFSSPAVCAAYLVMRMPGTFAAISHVLQECSKRLPNWSPRSLLDIGAGPGTGGWAAAENLPTIERFQFVEPNLTMAGIGQKLAQLSPYIPLQKATWGRNMEGTADVALLSYVIGEMTPVQRKEIIESLWLKADMIIVIEPGTPTGYRRILEVRDEAIRSGAGLVAPCPHSKRCPMREPDWCHFPARVERTKLHKLLKSASLGYEDEKFSYLAFGKIPHQKVIGRIVGNPQKKSGFVQIPLCTDGELQQISLTKKQELYRAARDAEYGDAWISS